MINQQVAALYRFPKLYEMGPAFVRWVGQFLQVLDGAQGVLVHRVTVIKVAHDQRINQRKLREDLHEQAQPLHRAQRQSRVIRAQDFPQLFPTHLRVFGRKLRVRQDVTDAALGFAA